MESFFKNDESHNVTVNVDRYRAMITNFFIPELNNHDVQELWFQQDGATCHTARATIDLLKGTFVIRFLPWSGALVVKETGGESPGWRELGESPEKTELDGGGERLEPNGRRDPEPMNDGGVEGLESTV
ncbi:hypothetical protein TNCV_3266031 [Trichonephila clavipes]|nr:hypothetical protein TNCV_3266031 [Trichonephila clavipes]